MARLCFSIIMIWSVSGVSEPRIIYFGGSEVMIKVLTEFPEEK